MYLSYIAGHYSSCSRDRGLLGPPSYNLIILWPTDTSQVTLLYMKKANLKFNLVKHMSHNQFTAISKYTNTKPIGYSRVSCLQAKVEGI